ncbi:MAG: hypothetical protein PW788_11350 [Micavibrio sp.]|nr:hypothetical protein [Micavibrio sp.]
MSLFKKVMNSLGFRCAISVTVGLAIVAIIAMGLVVLSGTEMGERAQTAAATTRFPEDEKMLRELSDQILRESAAHEFADIQPAAGGGTFNDTDSAAPATRDADDDNLLAPRKDKVLHLQEVPDPQEQ